MCKKSKNGANLQISRKYAVEKRHGATALAARTSRARLRWPVIRLRHGPIAATRAGLWSGATALATRATRAGLWCDFEKRDDSASERRMREE